MKETTRNNIVRYAISAAFVLTVLIVGSLIGMGVEWLTDKTGWPILPSFCIICFVYLVWRGGKGITVSDEEEQVVKLEPSNDLEEAARIHASYQREDDIEGGIDLTKFGSFIEGAEWKKEQIMKNAIEREVKVDAGGYPYIDDTELYDYDNDKPLAKAGDKVKVLIVKDK